MTHVLMTRRIVPRLLATLACACLLPLSAQAQNFPNKPVRLVVTYPAGGGAGRRCRNLQRPAAWPRGRTR